MNIILRLCLFFGRDELKRRIKRDPMEEDKGWDVHQRQILDLTQKGQKIFVILKVCQFENKHISSSHILSPTVSLIVLY